MQGLRGAGMLTTRFSVVKLMWLPELASFKSGPQSELFQDEFVRAARALLGDLLQLALEGGSLLLA